MIKLTVSDNDGTLERWHAGMKWMSVLSRDHKHIRSVLDEAEPLLRAYKERKGSFEDYAKFIVNEFWIKRRYAGVSVEESLRAARIAFEEHGDHFYVFTHELLFAAKEAGHRTVVISGSPEDVVSIFLERFMLDIVRGTIHPSQDGVFTEGPIVAEPVVDKGAALLAVMNELGEVDREESIAIGDSLSDVPMMKLVGYPICFKPNRELQAVARQQRWPIVVEDRNTHHMTVFDERSGHRIETNKLEDLLPREVADRLENRLRSRVW